MYFSAKRTWPTSTAPSAPTVAPPPGLADHVASKPLARTRQEQDELDELEAFLGDCDDRAWLQAQARAQLSAAGEPVDRLGVARRARRLADRHHPGQPVAAHHPRAG